jgi:hypothetical protein
MRNELTEPDEGVSVESQSIEELHGIRLLACVAWEEQEVPGSIFMLRRVAVVVVFSRRIRWLNSKGLRLGPPRRHDANPDQ